MRLLDFAAGVAGLCAFGLALYEAVDKKEFIPAGICFGVFVLFSAVFIRKLLAGRHINPLPEEPKPYSLQERLEMIKTFRAMISEVHHSQEHPKNLFSAFWLMVTVTPQRPLARLLEGHPAFLSLRPYLSAETMKVVWGPPLAPPKHSTMDGRLYAVARDIDRLEEEWGLRTTQHAARDRRPS